MIKEVMMHKDLYELNPFFRIRFGPPLECDLLLENRTLVLSSHRYLRLFASLDKPYPWEGIVALTSCAFDATYEEAGEIAADLRGSDLLVAEDQEYVELTGVRHWMRRGWLDALMLHLRSRNLTYSDDGSPVHDAQNTSLLSKRIEDEGLPDFWREFPDKPAVALGPPQALPADKTLQDVLLQRRSNQPWRKGRIDQALLSAVLYHGNRETVQAREGAEQDWHANPGALLNSPFCSLETYFFSFAVDGLTPGLYHYDPRGHRAVLLKEGVFRNQVVRMCNGQRRSGRAACVFAITSVWDRYMFYYRHARAYRTLLTHVSELAQKYILLATAFDLSTYMTPMLKDDYADDLLGVDGFEEAVLFVVAVG